MLLVAWIGNSPTLRVRSDRGVFCDGHSRSGDVRISKPSVNLPLDHVRLAGRLEQLDRIAVGIFQLDLFATGAYFHLIAKMKPSDLQRLNPPRKIGNLEDHPVPTAGLLLATIWHWPGTRSPGTAENQFVIPN